MIDEGLRTLLLAQPSVVDLVPPQTIEGIVFQGVFVQNAYQGFFPKRHDDADMPFVVIDRLGGDPMLTLDDYSETLKSADIEITSFSLDGTKARDIDLTIRQFLDDYTGACGSEDTIKAVLFDEPATGYDVPETGADIRLYWVTRGYEIQYSTP